jgi:hypothetical protein
MNIHTRVNIDDKVTKNLTNALGEVDIVMQEQIAQAAALHVAYTMREIPEAIKGKVSVQVFPGAEPGMVHIEYQLKGGEAATLTNSPVFISQEKLGDFSSGRTVYSKEGDAGRFFSKLQITGRPSINNYVATKLASSSKEANKAVLEDMDREIRNSLKALFAKNNIHYNTSLGRYQAGAGGATIPHTGLRVPGGQIISGGF